MSRTVRRDPHKRCVVHELPMLGSDAPWACVHCGAVPDAAKVRELDTHVEWPPRRWPHEAHDVISARREPGR